MTDDQPERDSQLTGNENASESVVEDDMPTPGERKVGSDHDNPGRAQDVGDAQDGSDAAALDGGLLRPGHDSPTGGGPQRQPGGSAADAPSPSALAERSDQGPGSGDQVREPSEVLEGILEELSPERSGELKGILLTLAQASESSWSAPLPEAKDFYRYEPADRERMMRWNDAGTSDESARQDKLVDAAIAESKAGPRRAIIVVCVCLALAALAGFWKENVGLAALFLSPPVIMFAQSLIASVKGSSSEK